MKPCYDPLTRRTYLVPESEDEAKNLELERTRLNQQNTASNLRRRVVAELSKSNGHGNGATHRG